MNVQPFLIGDGWIVVKDGNDTARDIFHRHYSRQAYLDGRDPKLIVGPGQKMVLLWSCARSLFVWRKFIDDAVPKQEGVNCAVFRNEGVTGLLSSELIRKADAIADERWPGERHYTYVNPKKIRSSNPGYCFIKAGWRPCGWTKGGLRILERRLP